MTDVPSPGTAGDTRPVMPRWVKVFAIITAIVIVVFVLLLLSGNDHGPGRHTGPAGRDRHSPPPGNHTP